MRWSARSVEGEYDFEVGRELPRDRGGEPLDVGDGGPVVGDGAVEIIGRLARDPRHLSTLRAIYLELNPTSGTVSDFIVVPRLFDAVHMGRLRVYRRPTRTVRSEPIEPGELADLEPATELATLAAAPEPAPTVPLTPAIEHQIAILQRAAESGAALCEECECE